MTYKEHLKKKDWVFALTIFGLLSVAFFLSSLFIEGHTVKYAMVNGLVHGVVFAGSMWLIEALAAAHKDNK